MHPIHAPREGATGPGSVEAAVSLLQSEIEEINRAVVRLALRKEHLEGAIRLLREHVDPVAAARSIDGASPTNRSPAAAVEPPQGPDAEQHKEAPEPSTAELVRDALRRNPDRWFQAGDVRRVIERPAGQVSSALEYAVKTGQVEREEISEDQRDHPLSRYRYRWSEREAAERSEPGSASSSVAGEGSSNGHTRVRVTWTGRRAVAYMPSGDRIEVENSDRDVALKVLRAKVKERLAQTENAS